MAATCSRLFTNVCAVVLLDSCARVIFQKRKFKGNTGLIFGSSQELNTSGGSAAVGSRGPTLRKEAEERDRLAALVKLQGRELDAIKAEINLLRFDLILAGIDTVHSRNPGTTFNI